MRLSRLGIRLGKLVTTVRHRALRQALGYGCLAAVEHVPLLRRLRPATVVDVGANVGQFALAARHALPSAVIRSFEPLPRPAAVFRRVFAGDQATHLMQIALGAQACQAEMYISARDDSSSLLPIGPEQLSIFPGTETVGRQRITVGRLDCVVDAADLPAPALLKIDVQGTELEVLRGCGDRLAAFDYLLIEASFIPLYVGQSLAAEVIAYAAEHGFVLDGVHNPVTTRHGQSVQADLLFRRRTAPSQPPSAPTVLVLVAPLPPPVHGASLCAAQLQTTLSKHCRLIPADVSPPCPVDSPFRHGPRMMAYLRALAHLVRHAGNERRHLYVLAAGGLGNLYNAVCLAAGRLLGYRLFIDHHSFSYLDRYDPVFGVLVRLAGPTAVHFVRCRRMARQLGDLYHRVGPIEIAPNLGPAPEPPPDRAGDPERPLVLGHLGNLSHNKGLDLVLAVACRARREGLPVRLVLAGPAKPADMPLILGADGVDYRGPVIGDDKLRFFKEIDVFLFPSRYRIETQPLVLVEATAYGVPVIATGRGCITDDFSPGAHVIVAPDDDFVAIALERLRNWTSDRSALTAARRAAWQQACVGHTAALAANADMIARLTGETP